ncbi:MAG: hypothetical protein IJT28_04765 [Bacteroidaceae bacterium]|nr:hypothetical protein [Bacteroidaceae bacterium]
MITEKQIQWLLPVYQEANAILDRIPNFDSTCRTHGIDANYFKDRMLVRCDFIYDENKGLYEEMYGDHGEIHQDIYGKTKREILRHIVNACIFDEAYDHYAYKKFNEECFKRNIDPKAGTTFNSQYFVYAKERESYCQSIVNQYIDTIEDSVFPPDSTNSENERKKSFEKQQYLSVVSKNCKSIVKVYVPKINKYSYCKLDIYKKKWSSTKDFCHKSDEL